MPEEARIFGVFEEAESRVFWRFGSVFLQIDRSPLAWFSSLAEGDSMPPGDRRDSAQHDLFKAWLDQIADMNRPLWNLRARSAGIFWKKASAPFIGTARASRRFLPGLWRAWRSWEAHESRRWGRVRALAG
jgi:hypothetical protein